MTACGTYAGYQRHQRRGEETCEPCRTANADYHAVRRVQRGETSSRGLRIHLDAARAELDALRTALRTFMVGPDDPAASE